MALQIQPLHDNSNNKLRTFFFPWRKSSLWSMISSLSRLHDNTQTHHTRQKFSRRVISITQRPLPDSTKLTQQTDIHPPAEFAPTVPSKRANADLRLRPHGHWDRLPYTIVLLTIVHFIDSSEKCSWQNTLFFLP
jgi:hypothetical protein